MCFTLHLRSWCWFRRVLYAIRKQVCVADRCVYLVANLVKHASGLLFCVVIVLLRVRNSCDVSHFILSAV